MSQRGTHQSTPSYPTPPLTLSRRTLRNLDAARAGDGPAQAVASCSTTCTQSGDWTCNAAVPMEQ